MDIHTPTNQVCFSFFRYPAYHAPLAFVFMGFKGLLRDRDMPAGNIRLMGCGSGDGFSIKPDFRTYCLMSALPDPSDTDALRNTRWYQMISAPSVEQLHFEMTPLSGHGSWDGSNPFVYSGSDVATDPFVVLTHARVFPRCSMAFWRSVPGIRRHLEQTEGCVYHIGFGEHPLFTLATLSVWKGLDPMQKFAYGRTDHRKAIAAARAGRWLKESIFVRFRIERLYGDFDHHPELAAMWLEQNADPMPANARATLENHLVR
jgi:spheroidene monooxygenase